MSGTDTFYRSTVAVIGANGYIGSLLVSKLLSTKFNIIRASRNKILPLRGVQDIKTDLNSPAFWDEIVKKADTIFHLASNTSIRLATNDPNWSMSVSVQPLEKLINAAQKHQKKPRVVLASTATVYGLSEANPVNEDTMPCPITVYDHHKIQAERILQQASTANYIDGVSLRLSNVYGPSPSTSSSADRGVLNAVTKAALNGKNLSVFGDGLYTRDYVYIDDVVDAFLLAGSAPELNYSVFNVCSGSGHVLLDVFNRIADKSSEALGCSVSVLLKPWPPDTHQIEMRNFVGDPKRINQSLGWRARIPLDIGIDRMIRALLKENYLQGK